jgi:hypothetical protein
MCDMYTWQRRSLFVRDKPILSSEMLHKDYDRKGSLQSKNLWSWDSRDWCQDEPIDGKFPVVKCKINKIGMICFAKPGLTEDLYIYIYIVQNEEVSVICYMCNTYTWQMPSIFIRDKPILSWERMLQKDYNRKGSVAKKKKKPGHEPRGAWRQDEMIGGKPTALN